MPPDSSHLRVPSDGDLRLDDLGHARLRRAVTQLGAEILGEIGHRGDVALAALVHPVHQLARAEGLAAQLRDERLELGLRQAEQVRSFGGGGGGHRSIYPRGQSSVVRKKYAISIAAFSAAVRAVHGVRFDALGEIGADRARRGLLRIGGAHDFAILRDGVLAFEHLHEHRTRGHVLHEVLEERTRGVHGVETFGLALRQMHHARGDDLEAGLFEAAEDLADEVTGNAVGLDDGKSALERHANDSLVGVVKARDCTGRDARFPRVSR